MEAQFSFPFFDLMIFSKHIITDRKTIFITAFSVKFGLLQGREYWKDELDQDEETRN